MASNTNGAWRLRKSALTIKFVLKCMIFQVVDPESCQAFVFTEKSLFHYDGKTKPSGRLVTTLKKPPNQVQKEFNNEQLVVSCWQSGLICYSAIDGKILWTSNQIPCVDEIVYSDVSKT